MTATKTHERFGRSIPEFCSATNLGRTTVYRLIGAGRVKVAKVGRRTIILTQPAEFLRSCTGDTGGIAA